MRSGIACYPTAVDIDWDNRTVNSNAQAKRFAEWIADNNAVYDGTAPDRYYLPGSTCPLPQCQGLNVSTRT